MRRAHLLLPGLLVVACSGEPQTTPPNPEPSPRSETATTGPTTPADDPRTQALTDAERGAEVRQALTEKREQLRAVQDQLGAAPSPSPAGPSTPGPAGPPAPRESAFESNQWNSAVGLGGGAGGRIGGRAGAGGEYRGPGDVGAPSGNAPAVAPDPNTEAYAKVSESGFLFAKAERLSTFAADVDTASYSNVRRFLQEGRLPPPAAVRVEEILNAMDYRDPEPPGNEPFGVRTELGPCPWQPEHQLLRIGLKTRAIDASKIPPCNLVFLLDVSGSMRPQDRLPLVQRAMGLLVDQLRPQDRVAIVTYASGVKVPLPTATGKDQDQIHLVITNLESGGSTNGQGGIQKAYEIALQNKVAEGVNRVILCTDGDFNVGIRDPQELETFIEQRRNDGVFLTVLGVGRGNLKDDRLERLANKGNGVYAYLDSLHEARRVLVEQFGASMMTVAKDVKLQVEFDPRQVVAWRQIGYENRQLTAQEFRDDQKDAGELGAGHALTALYEIVPPGAALVATVDASTPSPATAAIPAEGSPLATLRLRWKPPLGDTARELAFPVSGAASVEPSRDHRLAAAAAAFGMLLRGSGHAGAFGWDDLGALLDRADLDAAGFRQVVDRARELVR